MRLYGNIDLATTDATASSSDTVKTGDWSHVVMTYASTSDVRKIKLYIDGKPSEKLVDTAGKGDPTDDSASTLYIGGNNGAATFDGMIDEVKIYLYELTPEQVRKDFNENKGIALGTSKNKGYERSDGLISHWKMDEAVGAWSGTADEVIDSVGGNHGAAVQEASTTAGYFGNAGTFDGVEDYVEVTDDDSLSFGDEVNDNPFSISVWAYLSGSDDTKEGIIAKDDEWGITTMASDQLGFVLYDNAVGSPNLIVQSDATWANLVGFDTWVHIVGIYDGSESENGLYLYVNGQLPAQTQTVGAPGYIAMHNKTSTVRIGSWEFDERVWDGLIDDVKIWNRALSEDEVVRQYVEGPGPVGEWRFDENKGTSAKDYSGEGNTGTLTNMEDTDWVPGRKGNGLYFDGVNSYVDVGNPNSLQITGNLTISAWIKSGVSPASGEFILSKSQDTTYDYGFYIGGGSGRELLLFYGSNNNISDTESSYPNDGGWHHAIVAVGDTNTTFYVDGSKSIKGLATLSNNNKDLAIGRQGQSSAYYLNGIIDDVQIYNYNLTPRQIAFEYDGGGPVGFWKFDEGQGNTAYDSSEKGNNGEVVIGTGGSQTATSTAWINGQVGKNKGAMSFDGTDDYVDLGLATDYDLGTSDFTASVWIKSMGTNADDQNIIGKDDAGDATRVFWALKVRQSDDANDPNEGVFILYSEGSLDWAFTGDAIAADGLWHHLTGVRVGDDVKMYMDGVERESVSDSGYNMTNTDAPVWMGATYKNDGTVTIPFLGLIDDVKIYNYARTGEEVRKDYNSGYGVYFR